MDFITADGHGLVGEFDGLCVAYGEGLVVDDREPACGGEHEPFPLTAEQRERVNNLLSESDAARTFIMTGVERSAFPLDCITSTDLFAGYLAFCDERGWSPLSQRGFEMKAKDLMVQIHRACPSKNLSRKDGLGGQRGFQGVVLKQSAAIGDEGEGDHGPF